MKWSKACYNELAFRSSEARLWMVLCYQKGQWTKAFHKKCPVEDIKVYVLFPLLLVSCWVNLGASR